MNQPEVKRGDWIEIGTQVNPFQLKLHGYVLSASDSGVVEVGYYQDQLEAIRAEVTWDGTCWQFVDKSPRGTHLRGPEASVVRKGPPRLSMDDLFRQAENTKKDTN